MLFSLLASKLCGLVDSAPLKLVETCFRDQYGTIFYYDMFSLLPIGNYLCNALGDGLFLVHPSTEGVPSGSWLHAVFRP